MLIGPATAKSSGAYERDAEAVAAVSALCPSSSRLASYPALGPVHRTVIPARCREAALTLDIIYCDKLRHPEAPGAAPSYIRMTILVYTTMTGDWRLTRSGSPCWLPAPRPRAAPRQLRPREPACGARRTALAHRRWRARTREPTRARSRNRRARGWRAEDGKVAIGDRVGVPWLGSTDGTCPYCCNGEEISATASRLTGYKIDGGYASAKVADARYCFHLPEDDIFQTTVKQHRSCAG